MKTMLVMTIFALGVFATAPAPFALSGPFVPLSTERMMDDDIRDSDQSENERDVADSDNEGSTTSATQANDQ